MSQSTCPRPGRLTLAAGLAAWAIAGPLMAAQAGTRAISPESILRAQEKLPYDGTLLIDGVQRVHVLHGEGTQEREEYLNDHGILRDLLVDDGHISWHYMPSARLVRVAPTSQVASWRRRLALVKANYDFQLLGQARRAERPAMLVRFVPRHPGNLLRLLWVDRDTSLPLAVESRQPDGQLVDRSEYLRIAYRPHVPPRAFAFALPMGCRVESTITILAHGNAGTPLPGDLGFQATLPRRLPAGYAVLAWQLIDNVRKVPTLSWRLNDGLNAVSLFAVNRRYQAPVPPTAREVDLGTAKGYLLSHGAERMFMWTSRDTAYTLVGHLSESEMTAMALSSP